MATRTRALRLIALAAVSGLMLVACGGAEVSDDTDVLGLVIDRESETETPDPEPTEEASAVVDETPSATEVEATPTESETAEPTPDPTTTSPEPPPPPPPPPPSESAEAGSFPSGTEIWTINAEGVAERTLATAAPQTYERNDDGTTNLEPDLFGGASAEPAGDTSILASCTAAGQADDHRDLRVAGTLTVQVLVDGAVVASASEPLDTTIASGTVSSLLSVDTPDPITVGQAEGDEVEITCQVSLA